jgi:hypothetical protein
VTSGSYISCPDGSVAASQEICAAAITDEPQRRGPTQSAAAVRVATIEQTRAPPAPTPISTPPPPPGASLPTPSANDRREAAILSAVAIAALIVKESRSAYYATGHPCACPDDRMRNGHACGGRSAYSRPGGAQPLCYPTDVSAQMISDYRSRVAQR